MNLNDKRFPAYAAIHSELAEIRHDTHPQERAYRTYLHMKLWKLRCPPRSRVQPEPVASLAGSLQP